MPVFQTQNWYAAHAAKESDHEVDVGHPDTTTSPPNLAAYVESKAPPKMPCVVCEEPTRGLLMIGRHTNGALP